MDCIRLGRIGTQGGLRASLSGGRRQNQDLERGRGRTGGRELLYRQGKQFLSADVRTEPGLAAGTPHVLFSGDFLPGGREDAPFGYAVSSDGNAIYVVREIPVPEPERRLAIVTNWLPTTAREKEEK